MRSVGSRTRCSGEGDWHAVVAQSASRHPALGREDALVERALESWRNNLSMPKKAFAAVSRVLSAPGDVAKTCSATPGARGGEFRTLGVCRRERVLHEQ